ncbi:MAG: hypothetical protein E7641_09060 [Ruminococcaceae bacterium]|nr:hypothetical protein [Oscillospiraceae bacterium]
MKRFAAIFLALLLLCASLFGCARGKESPEEPDGNKYEPMKFTAENIGRYITLSEYSGLEITLLEGESKGDAALRHIADGAKILEYPDSQVNYYLAQEKAKYRYLASESGDGYEELLKLLGVTEESMLEDARALVKKDLVFYAVVFAEGIQVTEAEKVANFDKYVKKYVDDFGYDESYVRENMTEQIYESMLYDKTAEKLITMNSFK